MKILFCFVVFAFIKFNRAFLADWTEGVLGSPTSLWHTTITRYALKRVAIQYFNEKSGKRVVENRNLSDYEIFANYYGNSFVNFNNFVSARQQIENANAHVDKAKETKANPYFHFDAEKFNEANEVIKGKRIKSVQALNEEQYEAAREFIGQALHTIQDFYSHSNWIEMGKTEPNLDIGVDGANPFPRIALPNQPTCADCKLGSTTDPECHDNILADINAGQILTSGYYIGESDSDNKPVTKPIGKGKCSHGGFLDLTRFLSPRGGISKDADNKIWAPHSYLHFQAAQMAEDASFGFVNGLRNETSVENFEEFLGLHDMASLALVIDTSDAAFLTFAKAQASEIVRASMKIGKKKFILVSFDSLNQARILNTKDPQTVLNMISSLRVGRHSSIFPSKVLEALIEATRFSLYGSPIVVLTERSVGDKSSIAEYITSEKRVRILWVGLRTINSLLSLVLSTGGHVFTSMHDTSSYARIQNGTNVHHLKISGHSGNVSKDFFVESNIDVLTVTIYGNPIFEIATSEGHLENCQVTYESNIMQICQIVKPSVGRMRIYVQSNFDWGVVISSNSALDVRCQIFQQDSNPHQKYLVPISDGKFLKNSKLFFQCSLTFPMAALTTLDVFDSNGNLFKSIGFAYQGNKANTFIASFMSPSVSFEYGVTGKDHNGNTFLRYSLGTAYPSNVTT